jgi:hypothetical protein
MSATSEQELPPEQQLAVALQCALSQVRSLASLARTAPAPLLDPEGQAGQEYLGIAGGEVSRPAAGSPLVPRRAEDVALERLTIGPQPGLLHWLEEAERLTTADPSLREPWERLDGWRCLAAVASLFREAGAGLGGTVVPWRLTWNRVRQQLAGYRDEDLERMRLEVVALAALPPDAPPVPVPQFPAEPAPATPPADQPPPPNGDVSARATFDPSTQTITLDGTPYEITDPKAFAVYREIASACPQPLTKAKLANLVRGCKGEKTIPRLLRALPEPLQRTVLSGPTGYWLKLPSLPLQDGGSRRSKTRGQKGRT